MPAVRITKEFSFEAAHALKDHDGPCRNIHGHSYKLSVTVSGSPVTNPGSPKRGMIIDFNLLKEIVNRVIIVPMDHVLILPSGLNVVDLRKRGDPFSKVMVVNFQPTSENLLIDFAERLQRAFPPEIRLYSMKLRETATSYAEWFAD